MKDAPISFWLSDGIAWVKPTGEGSSMNAPKVAAFAKEMVRRGQHDLVVDLGECTGMDESFIGTLAGVALRLRELDCGKLQMVRCSRKLQGQLKNLGLEQLFEL